MADRPLVSYDPNPILGWLYHRFFTHIEVDEAWYLRTYEDIAAAIKAAEDRIEEVRRQRKKFEDEAEFYRHRQLPAEVAKGLRDADYEIRAQASVIESKKKDREAIRLKYDDDLRRFVELSKKPPGRP